MIQTTKEKYHSTLRKYRIKSYYQSLSRINEPKIFHFRRLNRKITNIHKKSNKMNRNININMNCVSPKLKVRMIGGDL